MLYKHCCAYAVIILVLSNPFLLIKHFVEQQNGGIANVERIGFAVHRNGNAQVLGIIPGLAGILVVEDKPGVEHSALPS